MSNNKKRKLLTVDDIKPSLKGKWISVMWTETGVWYDAEVLSIDVNNRQAQLWYPSDDAEDEALGEKEDINIEEAILDDEVSWPTDESKMRVTSEEAQKNAKRLKKERQKEKKSGGGASAASGKRLEQERREMQQKRDNVAKKFEESLNVAKAEEEAIGVTANAVENALNPSEIAIGIERALFERCGRDTGKEYGVHARSLMFNLRDPQNPTLRARVLHENVSAETLVKMTPAELANKELIEWRKKREEKIGEDAFLKGVPLEMIKVEKDGKGVSVHIKSKEEIEKEERGVETEGNTPAATPRVVPVGGNSNNNNNSASKDDDDDDNPFASSEKEKTRLEKEDEKEEGEEEEEEKDNDDGGDDSAKEDFISFDAYQREEEGDEEEGDAEEEEEEEMERNAPATSKEKNTAEDDDDDDGNEPGEIRPLEIGDWSGHVYVKGIDSLPAVALHFSPVGGELALLDKLLPDSSTLEIKGRVSLKDAEAFVRQIARQSNSRAVTIAEVETCMVNDKKQDASLLALAKHYEEKGRAGVSDDKEKKIEVYVFPRKSEEAMRLLKHMRAPGIVIRTENKKSGLLVAVIHKKGIGRNFKVIEAKAEKKRKEAKMKQLEIERAKKMKLLEAERLREAENYSPPDDGTSDFDEEFSEDDAEDRQEEEPRKPPPPPPKRVVTNNFGRGLTQTLVQPPPAPVVQQQQQQQQAPPPPPLVMAAAPQLHRQAPPPPPPVVVAAAAPPQQQHRQAPPPPPRNAVVVPPPPTQLRVPPPPPPIVHVPPPPANTNAGGDISQLLSSVSKFLPPQQQQQQQQQRVPPPPPPR